MTEFERRTSFRPAFDKRDPDPTKDYGIHGVELSMALVGPAGTVTFLLYTSWQLPSVQPMRPGFGKGSGHHGPDGYCPYAPLPADIGYHSRYRKRWAIKNDECQYVDGAPCWYDGSSLRAEGFFQTLIEGGDEALWQAMEAEYRITFARARKSA